MRATILAGLALVATFVLSGRAAGPVYPRTELTAQVDELFAAWDTEDSPGAALGIFEDRRIIYARGMAWRIWTTGSP